MNSMEIFAQAVDKACRCACGSTKPAGHEKDADLARRDFLRNAIASSAVVLAGTTIIRARPASAQSTLTPEAALKALMDGNQRYVAGQLQSLIEDLSILKAKTAEKQEPFAAVLARNRKSFGQMLRAAWTTGGDVDQTKPHPDLIATAAERLPEVSDFVVIGDTAWDAVAAGRAGFPAIGVLSGGFGASELRDAGCFEVFADAGDLAAQLDSALDAARSAPAPAAG